MYTELSLELHIGRVCLTSSVKWGSDGSLYIFPFSEPGPLRQFHMSIHGGVDDELRNADPQSVAEQLRSLKRVIPYKMHAKVGSLRLPRSSKDVRIEEMFGLWNDEEWHEEEFLLMSTELLQGLVRVEARGSSIRLRCEVEEIYRLLFQSFRVVGGREIERAKEDSALRRAGIFHPYVGLIMHPVVVRVGNEAASMGMTDELFASQEILDYRAQVESVTGGDEAFNEMAVQKLLMDAMSENREVMGFMIRTAARMAQGLDLAPPKSIWMPTPPEE